MPRAPGDLAAGVCGGFPDIYRINDVMRQYSDTEYKELKNLMFGINSVYNEQIYAMFNVQEYHRLLSHIENSYRRTFATVQAPDNHDLRVKFLVKEIDDKKMKMLVQQRDKAYRKNLSKNQVYQMAYEVAGDLFRSMIVSRNYAETALALENLFTYTNSSLKKIADNYSCVVQFYDFAKVKMTA